MLIDGRDPGGDNEFYDPFDAFDKNIKKINFPKFAELCMKTMFTIENGQEVPLSLRIPRSIKDKLIFFLPFIRGHDIKVHDQNLDLYGLDISFDFPEEEISKDDLTTVKSQVARNIDNTYFFDNLNVFWNIDQQELELISFILGIVYSISFYNGYTYAIAESQNPENITVLSRIEGLSGLFRFIRVNEKVKNFLYTIPFGILKFYVNCSNADNREEFDNILQEYAESNILQKKEELVIDIEMDNKLSVKIGNPSKTNLFLSKPEDE